MNNLDIKKQKLCGGKTVVLSETVAFFSHNFNDLGPPQTRRLVVDNYFLSTTLCRRQPKNIVCGANCRQLNAKILSCRRLVVSLVKKGNCLVVDNKLLSTTLRLTAFCRLWVRII